MARLQSRNLFLYSWHSQWLKAWSSARNFQCPAVSLLKLVNDTCQSTGACRNQLCAQQLFTALEMKDVLGVKLEQIWQRWVKVLCSQTEFMMKSTQANIFAEGRRKSTLCALLRGDHTPLPKWGMGGNITFFLVWVKFSPLFHTESLWVGKHLQAISPAPGRTPCSPITLASCRFHVKISCVHSSQRCEVSQVTCGVSGECSVFHKDKSLSQTR